MQTLNKSENKVLTILEEDCRTPANQIAKRCNLSTEGVLKIIKRLKLEKIITKFNTKLNYSKRGYKIYPVHIKLNKINEKIKSELENLILNHTSCAWFNFCEGEYDLLLSFKVSSKEDIEDMKKLLSEISDWISEKEVSLVLEAFELSKTFIEQKSARKMFKTFDQKQDAIELDKNEIELLEILKENSRETVVEISKKLNLNAQSISTKINKLKKLGIISGFKTKINNSLLNYQHCIALICLGNYSEKEIKMLFDYCAQKKEISYLVKQIGKYDLELTIDSPDILEFYKLTDDIREKFKFIKKITTLIAREN